ncbi:hypothetical protein JG688_00014680 [Phytophthora aleatoria]|uniref:Uncharacterized protein n=1 Tax=Phytophthora aleatoria TaxID=2496075 RepID=A0A8J5I6Z1_9STRA|nr:hypothetical protein JG688_00014680 [Phytophthora aleatoria]
MARAFVLRSDSAKEDSPSPLSSSTQSAISASSDDDATGLSDSGDEFDMSSTSASARPTKSTPVMIVSAAAGTVPTAAGVSDAPTHPTSTASPSSVLVTSTG